jgi:diguanylate cyclase
LGFDQQFDNELERYERYGTLFSLCVADIDFFKRVNDDFGHLAGEKCLRLVAKILCSNLRGVDFVARYRSLSLSV